MHIPVREYWNLLLTYLRPQWPRAALLALLLLGGIALQLISPQLLRGFIDAAAGGAPVQRLIRIALLFTGLAILYQVLAVAATYLGEIVGWTATNDLRADLAAHCLSLDLAFHKTRTQGEMIERIDGDVTVLSSFFSQLVIDVGGSLALMAGVLALLFREDPRVGLAMTGFAGAALAALLRIHAVGVPRQAEFRQANAEAYGFIGERIAGTEDIRSSGAGAYIMQSFDRLLRSWLRAQTRANLASFQLWSTTIATFTVGTAVAFALSASLWRAGAITIGTVYMIFYYTELLRRPIDRIRRQTQEMQKAAASIGRVKELLGVRSSITDGRDALSAGPLGVEARAVSFGYDGGEPVLRDVTFTLAAGRVLGLLGRTGSGKTSLARLLMRLYDPDGGELRLGGVPFPSVDLPMLRTRVGMVTQDVQLFAVSVRDNLRFFDPGVGDDQIVSVLRELGLEAWIAGLPDGLDMTLGSLGVGLSAGEAQLLAFARLFLRSPGLVILDEASSRVDPATEQLIDHAVNRLLAGRTGIIIAHRLRTVQRADEIMILDDGRILEHGSRKALAADPGSRFSQLLRTGLEEVLA